MKKKSLVGWMFPCERKFIRDYLFNMDYSPLLYYKKNIDKYCGCGLNHRPIKIRITIEEIT